MEIAIGTAGNLIAEVFKHFFHPIKRQISYVFLHEEKLKNFEKKVESLAERRDRVQRDVDAAENNGEKIHTDVKSWLIKADNIINAELKEVKGLQDKAKNKCFIGLCPNFKSRYQLSRKAEKDANVADDLLQQGGFDKDNVSYRDVPQAIAFAPPKDFEAFDSRKQVLNEIVEAVKDPSINIIGVYGMAGVGKTTLVKEVVIQVKEDKFFDSVVMAAVTQTPDIHKIQDQIADMLGLKFEEQSMTGRASRLCERLKKEKKILVVLDDIWTRLDPMELGIPFGDEHQGCTILLSSRDLNVLSKGMDAKKSFPIGVLKQEEAWDLFKKMAGDGVESPDLSPIATEVAKKCVGLPIAIKALARTLRNASLFQWRDALRQLNKPSSSNFGGVPAEAYSAIELSYNRLESEEHKQTFLLCSLMGHDALIGDLLKYAMGLGLFNGVSTVEETRNRLLTVVSHLKASCLLLDSYTNLRFDMHDLICDVAISIASKDNHVFVLRHEDVLNDWPDGDTMKSWDKISLRYAKISKLSDQLECPKLTFLCMFSKDPSMKMPTKFFQEMKNLKVLGLTEMHFPSLPSSISLLANLRTLCLDECVLGDIALIGELKNLEILSLLISDIEMLPKEIGQLIKLKLLDLSDCTKLKRIPSGVLCNLSRLEELYMGNSFVQWEAEGHPSEQSNASLAELKALSCLTALDVHIPNAKIIPKDLFFENLQRYNIFIGEDWDWDWENEYSRTLKLKLQTSIGFLNYGMKVLLKKAENLYLDEMKGVEILLHESEGRECFQQLKNLHIQNGAMIQYIIKANDGVHKIEFLQLQSLTLQGLPKFISFCFENNASTSISPQGMALFNQKIVFPQLEKLKLSSISIERIWLPKGFCSTQNLTSLIIEDCANLKHVLSYSMVEYLQQLKCLEIIECKCIQEIISTEEMIKEADGNRAPISFPQLNSLKLKGLQKLIGFCHEDYIVEFPALKILEIEHCPELKGFIHKSMSKDISTDGVLFNKKVTFPNLEKITISHLRKVEGIWYNQLHADSFSKLKELNVEYCDALLNIFSSSLLGVFQKLEILTVTDCASLEEVFQLQVQGLDLDIQETCVVASQLRQVYLYRLPKLKHVWNKDPNENISFENLREVYVWKCWSLKTLFPFSIAKGLLQLERLTVDSCGVEEIISKNIEGVEQEIWFQFNQLSFLMLWNLPNLVCFYPGMHSTTWPVLKKLKTHRCAKIKIFGEVESRIQQPLFLIEKVIPQLEEVSLSSDDIAMISDCQFAADLFCHIKVLRVTCYFNESAVFPFCFLQRFYNLEMLEMLSCNFKELSLYEGDVGEEKDMIITLPRIKKLKLHAIQKIGFLWKQDSPLDHICASLESLEVWKCGSLVNLASDSSSFQNLTTLDVWKCKEIAELITSSKAQNMGRLVTMKIRECEMMKEVVGSKGDEATYEIVFKELKCLELHCLQSLRSFCSGNYAFKFPSLEKVILSQCPRLKNFCQGALSTPKLQNIQLTESDYEGRWAGDLNATVEQLYIEQVGYRGLKHLKFSVFPELMDMWSRNPQEMLDFKNLEFLEVCDSNNLRCIFNLSMAISLGRLQQMEIKRCNKMEQVIKEEGSVLEEATADRKIISIFPLLRSIIVESCPDMTSFYLGSTALECPSLKEIEIADCPNMTTFVSTFSTDEDKEAIIDDETDTVTALFCDKVAFPNLEKITISHLRNVEGIWYNQLHADSFSKLKELKVEYCDALLNIFSSSLLGVFQKLEILTVTDCASLEEVFQLQVQGLDLDIQETCVVASQLRQVYLYRLPKLKHVWNKDPNENISFENLREVYVWKCWSLKTLFPFSIAKGLLQLERLTVDSCGVEEIISKNIEGVEQEIWFQFNQLSFLMLWNLPNLVCFYPGMHSTTWPVLKKLKTFWCEKIKIFGQVEQPLFLIEKVIPQLEEVSFSSDDIAMISDGQFAADLFCRIKVLRVTCYLNESAVFPFYFLQRFYNLEKLKVVSCNFKELSPYEGDVGEEKDMIITVPKIKKLTLYTVGKIRHLWKQDSPLDHICASLESLEVWDCLSLINLSSASSSFQNLTTLDVWECKEIAELITSSKAQSLARLVTMRIRECEMMTEVIASEGDEGTYEIIFRELKCLELHCLQNLKSFCSGNYTFKFPSLDQVIVSQCPTLKNFCQGALSTPKLQEILLTETDFKGRWAGDLNATVEQLYIEQVGYRGLKHLKFSVFPELMDMWSRNPQEMLDFKNLEFLEVCDSNNLGCIFNLSMAISLGRLQQMEIKRCNKMEQVIKEEGSVLEEATADRKIISIFPLLRSIIVESCPDMTSFYLGSTALECPSLKEIEIADCPNMTTFVSTFSTDEDKEAIIDDETDTVTALFCDKVAFPNLEKITISHLRNVEGIWYNQLHADSFSKLKELKVEYCDALLNIFSSSLLGVFQKLEILTVTDCASLEEVFQLQVQGLDLDIQETCVVASQLRQVYLYRLPKLKHVWNKDPNENISFENLREVYVWKCWSLKTLFPFSIAKGLLQLERLTVDSCGVEEIISKNIEGVEQEIWFQFNQLSFLMLWNLPNLVCFYPGMHSTTWPVLKKLKTFWCEKIKIFGQVEQPLFLIEKVIPQLEEVSFSSDDIAMISDGQFAADLFCRIKVLRVTCYLNESAVFPFYFLQRFYNLEKLKVVSCNFKELSPYEGDVGEEKDMIITVPKIKKLTLYTVGKIRHLWKQDSPLDHICASLESLEVWDCLSLINLSSASSSFQNLTTLDVWECKEIAELITSSKAQSLARLVTMRIRECEMMTEVIASEGDEGTYEIIFRELKCLELHCLQNLKSFCSGNYTFKFPSLDQVIVSQCPTLKNFCQGALSTPKLQEILLTETDFKGRWAGDLNATVEQLYIEQNVQIYEENPEDTL